MFHLHLADVALAVQILPDLARLVERSGQTLYTVRGANWNERCATLPCYEAFSIRIV